MSELDTHTQPLGVSQMLVSVIVPCYNAERWLKECLESVLVQTYRPLELSLWDDCSSDGSLLVVDAAAPALREAGILLTVGTGQGSGPLGCGAAKNRAVRQSKGEYLCFLDADDVMRADRVEVQLDLLLSSGSTFLVGSCVRRIPEDAQPRHTKWLNSVSGERLLLQRFCESTLAMPTWFCTRSLFDSLDGFSEEGPGAPEDLDFFYRHLRAGGLLAKSPEPLVQYRFHEQQQSHGVSSRAIWALRIEELESTLLCGWTSFSIWSCGRDGKRLYRSLKSETRRRVVAFLEVDARKLKNGHYYDAESGVHVPIIPWTCAAEVEYHPVVICVKRDLHAGFEDKRLKKSAL